MDSSLVSIGLPVALGIIMFGLGLDLTLGDFARIGRRPKAVAVALACQLMRRNRDTHLFPAHHMGKETETGTFFECHSVFD